MFAIILCNCVISAIIAFSALEVVARGGPAKRPVCSRSARRGRCRGQAHEGAIGAVVADGGMSSERTSGSCHSSGVTKTSLVSNGGEKPGIGGAAAPAPPTTVGRRAARSRSGYSGSAFAATFGARMRRGPCGAPACQLGIGNIVGETAAGSLRRSLCRDRCSIRSRSRRRLRGSAAADHMGGRGGKIDVGAGRPAIARIIVPGCREHHHAGSGRLGRGEFHVGPRLLVLRSPIGLVRAPGEIEHTSQPSAVAVRHGGSMSCDQ